MYILVLIFTYSLLYTLFLMYTVGEKIFLFPLGLSNKLYESSRQVFLFHTVYHRMSLQYK